VYTFIFLSKKEIKTHPEIKGFDELWSNSWKASIAGEICVWKPCM
jgi:hypothetical protein